jgi:hypothetical protein
MQKKNVGIVFSGGGKNSHGEAKVTSNSFFVCLEAIEEMGASERQSGGALNTFLRRGKF